MKKVLSNSIASFVSVAALLTVQTIWAAGTTTWSGTGGNQNWSTAGNWATIGGSTPPGTTDAVVFDTAGVAGAAGVTNNIVDSSVTIGSLVFSNGLATTFHGTQISAGNTLKVSGPIMIGMTNNSSTYTIAGNSLVGGSGTSTFTNSSINGGTMTLDMSLLNNFTFNAGGNGGIFWLGVDIGGSAAGVLKLAAVSNSITATTMAIGQNNYGGTSSLNLGAGTNILNVNSLQLGYDKATGTLQFNTSTGGLRLRSANGGPTTVTVSGTAHSGSTSSAGIGSILLNGHYVDMSIGTMTLGNRAARPGSGNSTAAFSFNSGIVNVSLINMATNTTTTTVGTNISGTLSVGGGVMHVTNSISLMGDNGNSVNTGTLIITNGGLLTCGGSIIKSTVVGKGIISVTNATLALSSTTSTIGNSSQPIDVLNLSNATIHLKVDNNNQVTSITATAINTNGTNPIVIDSVANASGTMTFTLISYTGTDPYGSLSLTLPTGYTGNLVDGAGQIQVSITAPPAAPLTWYGATNSVLVSNWDTNKTQNWLDASSAPQPYTDPDPVTFDDTAANSQVNVITTNMPNSVTFNNYGLNYVFSGTGKISGSTSLAKNGSGSLLLGDNGDDFSGGITVNSGTVILDNTNGNISGGLLIYGTAQIGNNDVYGALPAGPLDDEGTLVFQRANNISVSSIAGGGGLTQNGNGTLTLTASNNYTGLTTVSKGTLALSGAGTVSNSYSVTVNNAAFDVSAINGTTLVVDLNLTEATLNLSTTNLHAPLLVNTFEADGILAQSNIINITTLPGVAIYPATFPLIQSANPITLTGGNFNFILGNPLPQGSAGYLSQSADQKSVLLTLTSGPINPRSSVTWAGVDNTTATTNWSDYLNWQLPGVPGAGDNVVFDGSTTVAAGTVNNFVDQNFTVATLTYNQIVNNQWHVTQIPTGTTLTVSGATTVGGMTGDNDKTLVAMVDAGTLLLSNNLTIGDNGSGSIDTGTILDLSGLSNFVFNASSGTITLGTGSRSAANFNLASGSNSITAGTINANIAAASSTGSGTMNLGAGTNNLNVNTFTIAAERSSCTVQFPGSTTGGLYLRGAAGTDTSRTTMTVGNRTASGSSGTTTGTLSLNGHQVDMKLAALTVGECTATTPNIGTGVLQFDTGVIDTSNLLLAVNTSTGTANGGVTVGAGATLVVGSGGISLVNQSSTGAGTGSLTVSGGALICSNSILRTSTTSGSTANLTFTGGTVNMVSGVIGTLASPIDSLTLNGGTTLQLSVIAGATNIAANSVSASGTTTINIASFAGLAGPTQIPLLHYVSGDPFSNLQLGTYPAGYTISSLIDNSANQSIDIMVTPPAPVVWVGAVGPTLNSTWDTNTMNWLNGASPATYADVDYVQFDDTASNFVVTLSATVSPAGVTVNNTANNYTFNGAGLISGLTGLAKQGTGSLTLDNGGVNNFIGPVTITAGTLQIGNNDANGNLPTASSVNDNGTLAFGRNDSNTIPNLISGSGGVTQIGSGTNKLAAVNTYSGNTLITSGMIIATNANAGNSSIGSVAGTAIITNGGTLDIENTLANSMSFTNTADTAGKQFLIAGAGVGGNGAIVNNGTVNEQDAIQDLALTANATVGGPARWDLRVPDGHYQPILDLGGFTLTKTGSNQMSMVSVIVTNGGSIIINSGILSFEVLSSNSTAPITINAGGVLGHYRENAGYFTAPITLNGGMIRDLNGTPGSTNDSPITLTANSFLDLNTNSTDQLRLNGVISESGGSFGLTKTNGGSFGGSFSLAASNTYSGPTMVVQGTLILANNGSITQSRLINVSAGATFDASQRVDQTLTLYPGQTLSGFGTVTGIVATVSGSTVAPGSLASVGTLTFDNNVTLAGTNIMKVSRVSTATNDVLNVVSPATLTVGGTLNVISLGGTFVAGDTFKLFNAPGGLTGTFSATNLPVLSGGLGWSTTNLVNGILSVVNAVNTNPTNVTATVNGSTLTLTWPTDHTGWRLLVQTNSLASGLNPDTNTWYTVPGSAAVNTENITMDPTQGTVFYRLVYP